MYPEDESEAMNDEQSYRAGLNIFIRDESYPQPSGKFDDASRQKWDALGPPWMICGQDPYAVMNVYFDANALSLSPEQKKERWDYWCQQSHKAYNHWYPVDRPMLTRQEVQVPIGYQWEDKKGDVWWTYSPCFKDCIVLNPYFTPATQYSFQDFQKLVDFWDEYNWAWYHNSLPTKPADRLIKEFIYEPDPFLPFTWDDCHIPVAGWEDDGEPKLEDATFKKLVELWNDLKKPRHYKPRKMATMAAGHQSTELCDLVRLLTAAHRVDRGNFVLLQWNVRRGRAEGTAKKRLRLCGPSWGMSLFAFNVEFAQDRRQEWNQEGSFRAFHTDAIWIDGYMKKPELAEKNKMSYCHPSWGGYSSHPSDCSGKAEAGGGAVGEVADCDWNLACRQAGSRKLPNDPKSQHRALAIDTYKGQCTWLTEPIKLGSPRTDSNLTWKTYLPLREVERRENLGLSVAAKSKAQGKAQPAVSLSPQQKGEGKKGKGKGKKETII